MNTWIVSIFLGMWVILLWTFVYNYLFESLFLVLLGIYLGLELLDNMVILVNFLRNCLTFPQWLHTVFPPAVDEGSNFPHPGQHLLFSIFYVCFLFLMYRDFSRCEMIAHCGFALHFLMTNDQHLCMCLLAICVSCLEKCLFWSFAHFLNWIVHCWVVRSCLYILNVRLLPDVWFANISSPSVGCLFTLLIVSFNVHKFLILMRFNLSFFL